MHDYLAAHEEKNTGHVDYYGYDHCPNMIKLARLFLKRFPIQHQYDYHGFSDYREIAAALGGRDFCEDNVVVTFGHALVQVLGDPASMELFAKLIRQVLPSKSCLAIAADIYKHQSDRDTSREQFRALGTALKTTGVTLEESRDSDTRSIMWARLRME